MTDFSTRDQARKNQIAAALILGTDLGAAAGSVGLTRGLFSGKQPWLTAKELQRLAQTQGLSLDVGAFKGWPENAFYKPGPGMFTGAEHGTIGHISSKGNRAMLPVDVASHELGHGMAQHGKLGYLAKLLTRLRMPGAMMGGLGGAVGVLKGTGGRKSLAERERWLNAASVASGVGMLPTLADEASASRGALKVLRRLPSVTEPLRKEIIRRALLRLGRAWGSYGLLTGGLVLGPQMAKHYYRRND